MMGADQPSELPEDESSGKELSPSQLGEALSRIRTRFCTEVLEEVGVELAFPEGIKIGKKKTLGAVLGELIDLIKHYEPPIFQREQEEKIMPDSAPLVRTLPNIMKTLPENVEAPSEIPKWIEGYESLIWHGAHDNPPWRVRSQQYDEKVIVSYIRRQQELRPGKTSAEQACTLASVNNVFSLDEWRVAERIFRKYDKFEQNLMSSEEAVRKETKEKIAAVIKEEMCFKKGKDNKPELIKKEIEEALEQVSKCTRGFDLESINVENLTQRVSELLSQLYLLNRKRGDGKEKVPKVKPEIKETPTFAWNLSKLAECLHTQQEQGKEMTFMLGESGTGKTEAAEYIAAKTNRPFFWFSCGRGIEAPDLMHRYEFDTKEGTKRFLTALAEGLQTPGAIVYVNEVNALKPEVQAILHGLGDGNRSFQYEGITITAAEGVLIIIDGNPATYGAAGDIGEALLDRTRGQSMVMEYSALKKGELLQRKNKWTNAVLEQKEQEDQRLRGYACDEVLVLYPFFSIFQGLTDKEFYLLWEVVINENSSRLPELEANPYLNELVNGEESGRAQATKLLVGLRDILKIADTWRKEYEAKKGNFGRIGVSMRNTIALAQQYAKCEDVRKAYLNIFADFQKNPIEGLEIVYVALEELIVETLKTKGKNQT